MLRIGDMTDGLFEPALLVWGGTDDLLRFAQTLHDLEAGQEPLRLNDLDYCRSADGTVLSLVLKPQALGLTQESPTSFLWEIHPDDRSRFVDRVVALAAADSAGHDYLESGFVAESQIVIVSKGEYPDDFLKPED